MAILIKRSNLEQRSTTKVQHNELLEPIIVIIENHAFCLNWLLRDVMAQQTLRTHAGLQQSLDHFAFKPPTFGQVLSRSSSSGIYFVVRD